MASMAPGPGAATGSSLTTWSRSAACWRPSSNRQRERGHRLEHLPRHPKTTARTTNSHSHLTTCERREVLQDQVTSGNLAVANHAKDGRALRLFQGAKGTVQYIGEFVLDDQDPYDWGTAHSTRGGPQPRVIRFHLRRVDRPPPHAETGPLGVPFQPRNETMRPTSPTTRTPQDPDAAGRG